MTDEKDELEVYFEGEDHPISTEPEAQPEPKTEETVETTQVESEQTPEPEPDPVSEPTAEKPSVPEGYAPIAALRDERRKAQQAREEAEMLRRQVPVKDEAPDPYDDIDKYNDYMRNQWEQEMRFRQEQQRRKRLDASRSKMLEQHQDYDEMERIFELMTVQDTSLIDKMLMSGNEARFAYKTAKAYKDSLLKPVQTETESEPLRVKEVPNLAKATAQASNMPQVEHEATIDDIFEDMQY